jgi:hypothetical protein
MHLVPETSGYQIIIQPNLEYQTSLVNERFKRTGMEHWNSGPFDYQTLKNGTKPDHFTNKERLHKQSIKMVLHPPTH